MSGRAPRVRVWDLPTRLVHWALAVLVVVAWLTAGERMNIHRYAGYGILGLVIFRLYWGVVGGSTARFSQFMKGPGAVLAYVRGWRGAPASFGHNPLGALSVLLLVLLLISQVGLGLFAIDINGMESGPFARFIDFETGRQASDLHELNFRLLQAAVALHLVAIAAYAVFKRRNLVKPMVTGQDATPGLEGELRPAPLWRLVVGVAIAVLVVVLIARAG
ncbi:MAG: cytochrome b/b6 domain-containing protein [Phenylobacterium sp.]|uniref:cytochrome b/b6 domain-containing protein n=1 Tax=Phenylobacterium sp. TaxID=1871053 RepID=UPI002737301A|nr:cytochrome b/b6 domain-containing protein [Phenylobacterium sp.]MDP1642017.1 cytochrome b/b6 domain-containing protein [Phenylobacterium sp.]MDP3117810.1 cytochrome b/b6 domain-containing protein [Phenylobacterium sp.]